MDEITAACNVAEDYPGGARALARDIDKNPISLSHELNETGGAKLGVRTLKKMMLRSRDFRPLHAMAGDCGYFCLPLPESLMVDGNPAMQDLGQMAKEFADVVSEISTTCADDDVSANEIERVERQWGELIAAGQKTIAGLRAKHEAGKFAPLRRAA